MDNSLVLALVVGILTIVGTLAGMWIALRFAFSLEERSEMDRETSEKRWRMEQEKAEQERVKNERAKELENIRLLYQGAVQSLAALITAKEAALSSAEQLSSLVQDVHRHVSALMLRRHKFFDHDSAFSRSLADFTSVPSAYAAHELRDAILALASTDEELFPADTSWRLPGLRDVQLHLDDDFRRRLLLDGVDVPQNYSFTVDITKITATQRQKLCDMFFDSHKAIPRSFRLQIPHVDSGAGEVTNKNWKASINPHTLKPLQIFDAWEHDYDSACAEANQKVQKKAAS